MAAVDEGFDFQLLVGLLEKASKSLQRDENESCKSAWADEKPSAFKSVITGCIGIRFS